MTRSSAICSPLPFRRVETGAVRPTSAAAGVRVALVALGLSAAACGAGPETDPEGSRPAELEAVTRALEVAFTGQDIGAVGITGSTSSSPQGVHTVSGGGADIQGTADAFHFASQPVTGDVTITARLTSLTNVVQWTKAGVMLRDGSDPGARNVFLLATPTPGNGYRFQSRSAAGGTTAQIKPSSSPGTIPVTLRVVRSGNNFTASYSTNGTTFTTVGTVTIALPATLSVGLAVTSHSVGVLASGVFESVTIDTPTPPGPPAAPTGVSATPGNAQVAIAWNPVSGATSYTVKRATTSGGPFSAISGALAGPSFTDTTADNGTTYYYVVTATNASGEGPPSAVVSATPEVPTAASLYLEAESGTVTAPMVVQSDPDASGGSYIVSTGSGNSNGVPPATGRASIPFTAPSAGTYRVWARVITPDSAHDSFWVRIDQGTWVKWNAIELGTSWHWDTVHNSDAGNALVDFSLTAGNHTLEVAYRERGTAADRFFLTTDPGAQPVDAPPAPPPAPTGLFATAGNAQVALGWSPAPGALNYTLKRATSAGGPFVEVQTNIVGTAFTDTGLVNNTTYHYVVVAVNTAGPSPDSAPVSATPQPPPAPEAPTGLTATPGNNQVLLTWNAAANADSYVVKRGTSSGSHVEIAANVTGLSFTDTAAVNGTTYYYVVAGENATVAGPDSDEVSATPTAPPPAANIYIEAESGTIVAPLTVAADGAASGGQYLTSTGTGNSTSVPPADGRASYAFSVSAAGTYRVWARVIAPDTSHDSFWVRIDTGAWVKWNEIDLGTTWHWDLVHNSDAANAIAEFNLAAGNHTLEIAYRERGTHVDRVFITMDIEAVPVDGPPTAPATPTNLTATGGNGQVALSWSPASGAASYAVKRATQSGGPYTVIAPATTSTSYLDFAVSNGTPYHYVVSASNAGGESPNSSQASATPNAPPPSSWATQDVGTVGATGSWSESGGTHTVQGAGTDIWSTADSFRFVYQSLAGDGTVTARVTSLGATHAFAKAGVMVRESLTPGSKNVFVALTPTTSNGHRFQYRFNDNQVTDRVFTTSGSPPGWVRIVRAGNVLSGQFSTDGTSFTDIGPAVTVAMNSTVFVGVAVTSHVAGTLTTAVFDNVSVTTPAPPAPPPAPTGIGAQPGNNQVHLTWSAATGATSYSVKRATSSGGPYTTVASNLSTTSFTNTGLVNGTPYFFVVTAVNSAGSSPDSTEVTATPVLLHPAVSSVSPADGATNVATTAFVSADLFMPNVGGGVDVATLNSSTVFLTGGTGPQPVPAVLNTSGGADVLVLQTSAALELSTTYTFHVTSGLLDLTGASFQPFTSSFTTTATPPPPPGPISFEKVSLGSVAGGRKYTSLTIGPDNRLYAGTITGELVRWPINTNGTLGTATVMNTITSNNGGARAVIGLAFDPAATAGNLILWVTHGGAALRDAPDWTGKLSKLSGSTLATYQDVVVNFPRSAKDHMTNSIAFNPAEPGVIYISQGSMNAMGAPDNAWSQRAEHLLAAAILRLDTSKLGSLPLNAQTNDADPLSSGYNPFAANAPLTIYASGVRNAYDLLWHSNGSLYTATNGSAGGGATPATPNPLPSACTRRLDGLVYTGPSVPGIAQNPVAEDDYLYRVVQNGYFGHPNPSRCEWVLNGGNPTSGSDPIEVTAYPVGVQPDPNYRGSAYVFGAHFSPNGMAEWRNSSVFPQMVGRLLVVRYSGGDDIIALTLDPVTKNVSAVETGISGFTGFQDPLDLVINPANGHIYVTEYADAAQKVTLLRPTP